MAAADPLFPRVGLRAVLCGALLACGCANTTNLTSPAAPRYRGDHAPAPGPGTPDSVRLVTFNLKYGLYPERALELLRRAPLHDADLITLQEVDEAVVARLASALALNYVYYPSVIYPTTKRHFGPAILSRWPIERDWKLVLPYASWPRAQRRSVTAAVVRIGTVRVRVYAVHLEIPLRQTAAMRREQLATILCDAERTTQPVFIAGDFNRRSVGPELEALGYRWLTRGAGATTPLFSVDHVFVSGLAPAARSRAGIVRGVRGASDHRPVWTVVALQPDGARGARARLPDCGPAEPGGRP